MIIKRAFELEQVGESVSVTLPGGTSSFNHYYNVAEEFWNKFKLVLDELGISSSYDAQTGLGNIGGIPIMFVHTCGTLYMALQQMTGGSINNSVKVSYTGKSGNLIWQSIGVTIKGTANSFAVYIGSGSNTGAESLWFSIIGLKRLADNKILQGFLTNNATQVLYTFEDGVYIEKNKTTYPSTDYANSGSTYGGYALVQAVTTSMAYEMVDCYMGTTLLADASYYTIAGVSVVVVDKYLLLKC